MLLALIYTGVLLELTTVGWIDFKTQKISNRWILVNLIASILLHIFFQNLYPLSWNLLIIPVGFIIIGFFLYLLGVMGAGDSKFLGSLFLIIPLEFHLLFFEKLVLSTMITGAILLSYKLVKEKSKLRAYLISHHWQGIKDVIKSRFSYAPVIFVAWVLLGFNIWD